MKNWKRHGALLLKTTTTITTIQRFCSTIRKPSRHKQTSELETGNFSGWTTEKEESVVIPEELEQKFQTVEPQDSEIIFEGNQRRFRAYG